MDPKDKRVHRRVDGVVEIHKSKEMSQIELDTGRLLYEATLLSLAFAGSYITGNAKDLVETMIKLRNILNTLSHQASDYFRPPSDPPTE